MKNSVLVEILIGLPGSGKTHYAESANNGERFLSTFNTNTCYVDFDRDYNKNRSLTTILHNCEFGYAIATHYNKNYNHWILDGLFLTNDAQYKLVSAIYEICKKCKIFDKEQIDIQFVYFKENREACLFNDSIRQNDRRAQLTIKSAEFEKPNIEELSKMFGEIKFSIKNVNVHKMNVYESVFKIHESYQKNDEMRSDEWSLGGTWGDCWGNSGTCGVDEQPTEFKEFDDLLMKVCPNITLLQYKKLYRETVTTETRGEHDYYGGYCSYGYYACDLKKLYELLVEMGLLEK